MIEAGAQAPGGLQAHLMNGSARFQVRQENRLKVLLSAYLEAASIMIFRNSAGHNLGGFSMRDAQKRSRAATRADHRQKTLRHIKMLANRPPVVAMAGLSFPIASKYMNMPVGRFRW